MQDKTEKNVAEYTCSNTVNVIDCAELVNIVTLHLQIIMPTTDFGWPVQRTPVFQVFGTKRKSGIDEDGSSYAEAQEVNIF